MANLWGRDRNILATIAKLLSTAYVVSDVKVTKKGDAFKVRILQARAQ